MDLVCSTRANTSARAIPEPVVFQKTRLIEQAKIITAAAALETQTVTPGHTVFCPGAVTIFGHTYHDWTSEKGYGHGWVDMHRAIVVSCDVYFFTLGKMLGIDKIAYFAKNLGLGSPTGIDLPSEESGLVPSPEWVRGAFKRQWWPGETMPVAIGQGAVTVTPLQLAYAIGGIAEGGEFHRPHMALTDNPLNHQVKDSKDEVRRFPLHAGTVEVLTKGMWGVVNDNGGTGAGAKCAGLNIGGKTGTAQVVSAELQRATGSRYKNNGWFVGLSPSEHPEIVVATLVMRGEHSSVCTPITRDVIRAYYVKRHGFNPGGQSQMQAHLLSPPADRSTTAQNMARSEP